MKKSVKVFYYVDNYVQEKELEYKEDCSIVVEDGIVYVRPDNGLQLAVNKDHFISLEKIEEQAP